MSKYKLMVIGVLCTVSLCSCSKGTKTSENITPTPSETAECTYDYTNNDYKDEPEDIETNESEDKESSSDGEEELSLDEVIESHKEQLKDLANLGKDSTPSKKIDDVEDYKPSNSVKKGIKRVDKSKIEDMSRIYGYGFVVGIDNPFKDSEVLCSSDGSVVQIVEGDTSAIEIYILSGNDDYIVEYLKGIYRTGDGSTYSSVKVKKDGEMYKVTLKYSSDNSKHTAYLKSELISEDTYVIINGVDVTKSDITTLVDNLYISE